MEYNNNYYLYSANIFVYIIKCANIWLCIRQHYMLWYWHMKLWRPAHTRQQVAATVIAATHHCVYENMSLQHYFHPLLSAPWCTNSNQFEIVPHVPETKIPLKKLYVHKGNCLCNVSSGSVAATCCLVCTALDCFQNMSNVSLCRILAGLDFLTFMYVTNFIKMGIINCTLAKC